jgi:hypothetical protein
MRRNFDAALARIKSRDGGAQGGQSRRRGIFDFACGDEADRRLDDPRRRRAAIKLSEIRSARFILYVAIN